jgi:hypothetical protein
VATDDVVRKQVALFMDLLLDVLAEIRIVVDLIKVRFKDLLYADLTFVLTSSLQSSLICAHVHFPNFLGQAPMSC